MAVFYPVYVCCKMFKTIEVSHMCSYLKKIEASQMCCYVETCSEQDLHVESSNELDVAL